MKTLLAGGQVSADQVKDSFGEPMKNKVLYVNPRDNRTYSRFLSRQERSERPKHPQPRRGPMSRSRAVSNDSNTAMSSIPSRGFRTRLINTSRSPSPLQYCHNF